MNKVIVEKKYLEGVPLYEYRPVDINLNKLVFYQHGYTMNKEDGAHVQAMHYASRGFTVVAIDAYGHGERHTKPFPKESYHTEMLYFYEIIKNTTEDFIKLYKNHYEKEFPVLNVSGESMGGMITYMLAGVLENVKAIAPVVGSPSIVRYGYDDMITNGCEEETIKGMLEYLQKYDGFTNIPRFIDMPMFCLCGTQDDVA